MSTTAANDNRIEDIPAEEYHQRPELSRSQIKRFLDSPRDFRAEMMGWIPPLAINDKLAEGELTHTLLLEPHKFDDSVAIIPETWIIDDLEETGPDGIDKEVRLLKSNGAKNTRGKDAEQAWREFEEANAGRIIVKAEQIAKVRGMVRALGDNLGRLLHVEKAVVEPSLIWRDDLGWSRARPDYLLVMGESALCVDIKTTAAKSSWEFDKFAQKLGYIYQDAHYSAGVRAVFPTVKHVDFVFLAINNPPTNRDYHENYPHKVWAKQYDEADRLTAVSRWREVREEIAERTVSGDWADPDEGKIETFKHYWK
jgi:hypothetical protein